MSDDPQTITPEILINAYANGVFPMADSADDPDIYWVDPEHRGVIPLNSFHVSRNLARTIKRATFRVAINTQFEAVMRACADRDVTWINDQIIALYKDVHAMGLAHSIEVYRNDILVGGAYGIALNGAFFGESMFSRETNASKVALTYLVARLRVGGFSLLDTQFLTPHLASLGAVEIPRAQYHDQLETALDINTDFLKLSETAQPSEVLHFISQTS